MGKKERRGEEQPLSPDGRTQKPGNPREVGFIARRQMRRPHPGNNRRGGKNGRG